MICWYRQGNRWMRETLAHWIYRISRVEWEGHVGDKESKQDNWEVCRTVDISDLTQWDDILCCHDNRLYVSHYLVPCSLTHTERKNIHSESTYAPIDTTWTWPETPTLPGNKPLWSADHPPLHFPHQITSFHHTPLISPPPCTIPLSPFHLPPLHLSPQATSLHYISLRYTSLISPPPSTISLSSAHLPLHDPPTNSMHQHPVYSMFHLPAWLPVHKAAWCLRCFVWGSREKSSVECWAITDEA